MLFVIRVTIIFLKELLTNNQQPRRRDAIREDIEVQILAYVRADPRSYIRHVSRVIYISYGVVKI